MHECEAVFHTSKSDILVCAAVKSWALLLSLLPPHLIQAVLARWGTGVIMSTILLLTSSASSSSSSSSSLSQLPLLTSLLGATADLSVRVAVGQAVALLFELVREVDDDLLETEEVDAACTLIRELASESNR